MDDKTVVYEMGSGWGDFSFAVEKFNSAKVVGYELSPVHLWFSSIKAKFKGSKVEFLHRDFFKADISDAGLIYVFLVPKVVQKLWLKIKQECRHGTVMILLGHELEGEKYFKKIETKPGGKKTTYYYFYKV